MKILYPLNFLFADEMEQVVGVIQKSEYMSQSIKVVEKRYFKSPGTDIDSGAIYLIILTPITIAVMYAWHCIKRNSKRFQNIEEAKPYQFERDEIIPEFDEFTQMLVQRRMYKGRADK